MDDPPGLNVPPVIVDPILIVPAPVIETVFSPVPPFIVTAPVNVAVPVDTEKIQSSSFAQVFAKVNVPVIVAVPEFTAH